jgi:ParB family chromosome partitioning protein
MSKKTSFADLLGKEQTEQPAGPPPVSSFLHTITGNPDNPRDAEDLELDELIQSFREVGQLQPVLAMSRDVYLRHKPDNRKAVGDAQFVILGGNRRLEAARQLGWARIDIQLRDDLGDGGGSLDEAVIIENIHRKALAPMREAVFLQGMVERYGSQGKVAQRIGKTQAYVSQRLGLLKLEPELQQAVDTGQLKVKEARKLASVPKEEQQAVWRESQQARVDEPARTHNPVMAEPRDSERKAVVDPLPMVEKVPDPRRQSAVPAVQDASPAGMPWDSGDDMADLLIEHMDGSAIRRLTVRLLEHNTEMKEQMQRMETTV